MSDPQFKTPEEVAAVCRVTRRAVYDWLREGKLKGYRAGTRWLIKPADLEAFLGSQPDPDPVREAVDQVQRAAAQPRPQQRSGKRRR